MTKKKIVGVDKNVPLQKKKSFPIVGIGSSSGGLEAVMELLKALPADTGMAFIVIQHLSPDVKSMLPSLLAKSTKMKVQEIGQMELIRPDNVYVIPYNRGIEVAENFIRLIPRIKHPPNLSIDILFNSLAEKHKENAIGIVLSGNAFDGTAGLKAIRREGGITFAQDSSAKYGSMPGSAISEGVADFIMAPKAIARELMRISKLGAKNKKNSPAGFEIRIEEGDPDLKSLIAILCKVSGIDFRHYKIATIRRRLQRRMFLHQAQTLKEYLGILKNKSNEAGILCNDLLINVTGFFRDPETFRFIKSSLLRKLFKNKRADEKLRIWVPACSTGQEAYSLAMLLVEILGERLVSQEIQIFASDISIDSVKKARAGEYSAIDVKDVGIRRLSRFFKKAGNNYRVVESLRKLITFSPHNILNDPPFSKMDLISCRNLFIYLTAETHKKVLATFHYALKEGGYLCLGKSESVGSSSFFTFVNRPHNIYQRKSGLKTLPYIGSRSRSAIASGETEKANRQNENPKPADAGAQVDSILFSRFIPAYVLINDTMEVIQFKGATSNYFEHATGKATLNIFNMARPEIAFELRNVITRATEIKAEVRKTGIQVKLDSVQYELALDVVPVKVTQREYLYLVVFTEQASAMPTPADNRFARSSDSKRLKEELARLRAELISSNREKEKANKILQETNENILVSNEEFQSLNEELETSKEEIESANEELIATNQELHTLNEHLVEAYRFSELVIANMHEPMLIMDRNFCVRTANKSFYHHFRVLPEKTEGKLLFELGNGQWNVTQLRQLLENVVQKDTHFHGFEITQAFPGLGIRTMLLNAKRLVQKDKRELLVMLAFADTTEGTRQRKQEKKELENIISERTAALASSYKALKEKNVSLAKMNKELETFTFISSHDLQEPLRKIKNFVSILSSDKGNSLTPASTDNLQKIGGTAKRMQSLIEDLLAYSRTRNPERNFEPTDLNKFAEEVSSEFRETYKERNVTIKVSGQGRANIIRFQFRQLLHNLLGNSFKFSDPERQLVISISCRVEKGNMLGNEHLLPEINYCNLVVSDNGIGFDSQYSERIFEVFQRLHGYEEYKGTGMGLAICKRIVENHGGIISATSMPGKGARFDIYIPAFG
jgi:two-component system, chemotaxis family, CheB/CheR fusion protein